MKKFLFNLLIVVSAFCAFSSCKEDEDRDIAVILSGEWEGNFGATYTVSMSGSRPESYSTKKTRLQFTPSRDYSKHGSGVEVDIYSDGPFRELVYEFKWTVDDGRIFFEFPEYEGMDFVIENYKMDSDSFYGYINDKRFNLHKLADYYDWTPYHDYFNKHPEQPGSRHEIDD